MDPLQSWCNWGLSRVGQILVEALLQVRDGAVRHVAVRKCLEGSAKKCGVVPACDTGGWCPVHLGLSCIMGEVQLRRQTASSYGAANSLGNA